MAKKNRPKRFYDYSLLFCIIFLSVFGLVMIYSASSYTAQLKYNNAGYFMMRQLKIGAGGLVLALIISKLDYHWYAKFSMFAYLLSYVLMIAVTLVGKKVNGKKRWLGIGSLSFQPTEFVKIALIIFLAVLITRMGASVNTWKNMVRVMGFALPIAGIVAANNLSSGIIIAGIAVVVLRLRRPGAPDGSYSWSPGNFSREDQAVKAVSVKPYPCMAFSGKLPDGWWLPGASGTLRHRLRRPFWQGTGREYPEDGLCA